MKRKDALRNLLLIGGGLYLYKMLMDSIVESAVNEIGRGFDEGGKAYAGARTVTVGPDGTTSR